MASDILKVQEFLHAGFLSCALFDSFNVVLEREFMANAQLEFNSLWQIPRAGQSVSGIGLLIEMPKLEIPRPNSLQRNLVVSAAVIEERNTNMTPGIGTMVSAEELAELALDMMFGWMLGLSSGLTPESGALVPATDLVDPADGLVAYRAAVSLRRERRPAARCDVPSIIEGNPGVFSLVNGSGSPDAEIYFSRDGSFPGKASATAVKYTEPVELAPGEIIHFAAWLPDRMPSHVQARLIG